MTALFALRPIPPGYHARHIAPLVMRGARRYDDGTGLEQGVSHEKQGQGGDLGAFLMSDMGSASKVPEKAASGADFADSAGIKLTEREQHAYNVIEQAVQEYQLDAVYVLLSGGHDSLTAAWIAAQHPKFSGVIHAETRTGYIANEVTKFVVDVCRQYDWHLIKKHPATSYLMLVSDFGFPGAARHQFMYRYLKERPIAAAKKRGNGAKW